jgi:hypothetical protein
MATTLIAEEDYLPLSQAIITVSNSFSIPKGTPLHWNQHVKQFARRQYVTSTLAAVPRLIVNYLVFEKASIPTSAAIRANHLTFYNYAAGLAMERMLLTAQHWPGGPRDLKADFGHVRGINHNRTLDYFQIKKNMALGPANWGLLHGTPRFLAMSANSGLQAADQYAGILSAAMNADPFGGYEPQHLLSVRHQIRRNRNGVSANYGFKAMTLPGTMNAYPWWPANGL